MYVLGAVVPVDAELVERHLDECAECADLAAGLADVRDLLDQLDPADVARIVEKAGWEPDAARSGTQGPRRPANRSDVPAGTGRSGSPRRWAPRMRPRQRLGLVAVALALVVGIGLGVTLAARPPVQVTMAGSETSELTGASISVTVTGAGRECHLEARITGLLDQVSYRMYAVGIRGQTVLATEWIGASIPQTIAADVALPAQDLASITVATADDTVVVSVHVVPTAS